THCVPTARAEAKKKKATKNLEFTVRAIIAAYAGNVTWDNWIIQKKLNTWKLLEQKNEPFLLRQGFTHADIEFLKAKDKF
ncbi:MAG: hypothetical protein ACRC2M_22865, partial [Planktothrix sp.]